MKISTWNINSLAIRLPQVLAWLAANPVDALCLQELKLSDEKFPSQELADAGYESACFGQKTYNGVAVLSRTPPRDIVRNISGFADEQSRVIAVTVDGAEGAIRIVNGYFVNGQSPGSEKFAYKMKWLDGLRASLTHELAAHPRLVLAGDSAGGGYALALAEELRDRGRAQPEKLVLIAPWVDLTSSAPETREADEQTSADQ